MGEKSTKEKEEIKSTPNNDHGESNKTKSQRKPIVESERSSRRSTARSEITDNDENAKEEKNEETNRETMGTDHSKKEGKIRGGKSKEISKRIEEKKNQGSSQKDESPIDNPQEKEMVTNAITKRRTRSSLEKDGKSNEENKSCSLSKDMDDTKDREEISKEDLSNKILNLEKLDPVPDDKDNKPPKDNINKKKEQKKNKC